MDWQSQLLRTTESSLGQMTEGLRKQTDDIIREGEKKRSGFNEAVSTLLDGLDKLPDRKSYEVAYNAYVADPQIRKIFDNSSFDFESFKTSRSPEYRFGNEDLRAQGRVNEEIKKRQEALQVAESPVTRNLMAATAKAKVFADSVSEPVFLVDYDTGESLETTWSAAQERLKSPKAGKVRLLTATEYRRPSYVFDPESMMYEAVPTGALKQVKDAFPKDKEFRVLSELEFQKQEQIDGFLRQNALKSSVQSQLLMSNLDALSVRLLPLEKSSRVSALSRMLEKNTFGIGRTGKTSPEGIRASLLSGYTDLPPEVRTAKFYNPETKKFESVLDYRMKKQKVYEYWANKEGKDRPDFEMLQRARLDELKVDYTFAPKGEATPFYALAQLDRLLDMPVTKPKKLWGGN